MVLKDDDPATIERMLKFLYTRDYDDQAPAQIEGPLSTLKDAIGSMVEDDGHEILSSAISKTTETTVVDRKVTDQDLSALELSRALINIAVYAIAEKYDLKDLKMAAKNKCLWQPWVSWPLDDLRVIAKEVYSSTPSPDRGLRDKVICDCAYHAQELTEQQDWISMIKMDADFGFDLFQKMTEKQTETMMELENSQYKSTGLLRQKVELRQENDELQQKMANFDIRLDEAFETAKERDSCRHCLSDFESYLERRGRSAAGVVQLVQRCKKCRTRHAL